MTTPLPRHPTDLPIEAATASIEAAIGAGSLVLTAEPGAGKTSIVPLVSAPLVEGRVLLLQPRRLAARAAAARLSDLLEGQHRVGGVVGLTIRGEHRVGPETRIEVVTEAILTNRLQRDPELPGVGAIIFDEFHERNLHSDLGLALALEARATIRPDLAVVVMSATLDAAPVARLLDPARTDGAGTADGAADGVGGVAVVAVPGRTHPVETVHLARPPRARWAAEVATVAGRALGEVGGDVLVFVPGRREINDVIHQLASVAPGVEAIGLHGGSDGDTRRRVLSGDGPRRVVVATAVAETSVTLPRIEGVVDGGLSRRARFDPTTGLGRLDTGYTTRFAADQRRGRAGRLGPGRCYRLWSIEEHRHLDDAVPPEITDGDPIPIAFELVRWGDPDATDLALLDHPGPSRLAAGRRLLTDLGLLDDDGALTGAGRRAGTLGLHPRIGALLLTAAERGMARTGARVAALLDDDRPSTRVDLTAELDGAGRSLDRSANRLLDRLDLRDQGAKRSRRDEGSRAGQASRPGPGDPSPHRQPTRQSAVNDLDTLLSAAWPDRIAMRRPGRDDLYLLANGREAELGSPRRPGRSSGPGPSGSPLAGSPFLVVAEADGEARRARIRLAVATDRATVLAAAAHRIRWHQDVRWDDRSGAIVAERQQTLGAITLHREPLSDPPPELVVDALRAGLRRRGLDVLPWSDRATTIRHRLAWLAAEAPDHWPAVDDQSLLDQLDHWLDLSSCRRPRDLDRLDIGAALLTLLDWQQRADLDRLAPVELATPRGRPRRIGYDTGRPVVGVRIQHLFGLDTHPTVGPNRVPITIELLSPADRPAQVTTDLPGFWRGSYAGVRADLRGRYPKHAWPEHPWDHPET